MTSPHTGRSPKDKFVVEEPGSADRIWWEKDPRLEPAAFERLHEDVRGYLAAREMFVQDLYAGADPAYRLRGTLYHARTPGMRCSCATCSCARLPDELAQFRPGFTVLHAPDLRPTRPATAPAPARSSCSTSPSGWC